MLFVFGIIWIVWGLLLLFEELFFIISCIWVCQQQVLFLFIWDCIYFTLIFKRELCWILDSLVFFYFEYFDCLVPLPLYTSIISDEKLAVILLGFPNKRIAVSLDTFKIFSPSLAFSILTVCLGVYLLVFILLGFHWGSWICRLMF